MNIYVVRHGETDYNRRKVYFGWSDICLNEAGRKQCIKLKEELIKVEFTEVWASSSQRTIESARIIANESIIKTDTRFRELNFGQWEGLDYLTIEKEYPLQWKAWGADWQQYSLPGGESFMDFYKRVEYAWMDLKNKMLMGKKEKNILLVVHGGTVKVIQLIEKKLPLQDFWQIKIPLATYKNFEIN